MLRWTPNTDGITLTVAGNGVSSTLNLQYDRANHVFILKAAGKEKQVFFKLDSKEPPDLETDYNAEIDKTYRKVGSTNKHIPTEKELLDLISQFASNSNTLGSNLIIKSNNKKYISLHRMETNNKIFTSIYITSFFAGKNPSGSSPSTSNKKPEGDFEVRQLIPADSFNDYLNWLQSKNIKYTIDYYLFKSQWKLEGYEDHCSVNNLEDLSTVTEIIKYLVEHTLQPFEFPAKIF